MRHILLLTGLLTVCTASAQFQRIKHIDRRVAAPGGNIPHGTGNDRQLGTALWTEDFEGGLGGWTVSTTAGAVSWQLTSTGNTGGYTPGPLQSTSGFPGGSWIVADSDEQGTPGVSETSTITSPPITGLDTVAFALLRFEQSFRQLNDDQTVVEVSGNGGLNWTSYPVNTEVPGNQSTPGAPAAQPIVLNISAALNGGASDIRIRFRWHSDEGYTYSWQVDDIALYAAQANDLSLDHTTWSVWDLGQSDLSALPYTVYPESEVRPLNFRGRITNNGSTTQTNVRLQVAIDGPGSNDIILTSAARDLAPLETDSFFISTYTPPAVSGTYAVTMTALQDEPEQGAEDNTDTLRFAVDPFVFARDNGVLESDLAKGSDEYILGNWFHINGQNHQLTAVQVALSDRTDPGASITVAVYDDQLNQLAESDDHVVQASELNMPGQGQFLSVPFGSPVLLLPNEAYFVAVHHYGGAQEVWTGISGSSPEQTSLIYDGGEGDWFYTRSTPMVRMSFDPTASVEEGSMDNAFAATAAPSLFATSTTVRFTLATASPLRMELVDMSGRTVQARSLGRMGPGAHQVELSGEGLAPGTYFLRLLGEQRQAVVKLVRSDAR